ncbi:hypothetical protein Hbl1158_17085 (plasmid) [Halobaculum sp. CBA1158]|uniref:hypothetical protein n=1 Tax=Halobaculum sp. CBA1158 TaxID=2904243 RepID=UPI001F48E8CD|nr:hypothetical protein [Halobaculum sp. CBA1158]UIP01717.1 hypothetical protein Hbl1158_17085 [Halobaculum sp. CBA1158]
MSRSHQSRFGSDGALQREEKYPNIDGAESLQRPPTDAEVRWGITGPELERRVQADAEPTSRIERRCSECGKQVTETPAGVEVGHAKERDDGRRCPARDGLVQIETLDDFVEVEQ